MGWEKWKYFSEDNFIFWVLVLEYYNKRIWWKVDRSCNWGIKRGSFGG